MLMPVRADVIDVDGNGWSSRFHRLLLSGSVVLKSTIYAEWFTVRLRVRLLLPLGLEINRSIAGLARPMVSLCRKLANLPHIRESICQ